MKPPTTQTIANILLMVAIIVKADKNSMLSPWEKISIEATPILPLKVCKNNSKGAFKPGSTYLMTVSPTNKARMNNPS